MGEMMRAVIDISHDISPLMPVLSEVISGCAYNPDAQMMSFRHFDMGISVEPHKIVIYNAEDEATAQMVINWLIKLIDGANNKEI
ncbi:hypothetical protein ACFLYQ_05560 [Chloroflexota bacterium]